MRVTELSSSQLLNSQLLANREQLSAQQLRIASGNKYTRRSEAPVETSIAADLNRRDLRNDQWLANVEDLSLWEVNTQFGIERGMSNLHRLRELTVTANNGTASAEQRSTMAAEIDEILKDMADVANTRVGDSYLFGGDQLGQPPMAVTLVDDRITAMTYQGGDSQREARIGEGMTIGYGATAGGPAGIFAASVAGVDIMQTAIDLRDALLAGDQPPDTVFDDLDDGISTMAAHLAQSGLRQQRYDSLTQRLSAQQLTDSNRRDALVSTDMSEAAVELSRLQVTFQASLQMAASLQKLSIVNFI